MDDEMLSLCKVEEIEKEIEDADAIRAKILEIRVDMARNFIHCGITL
jgi:3-dehydroquinate dehydratase